LTYTIDPEVKGTVTIHSAEPLKKEDLLPIFHQILRMNGAVAVKTGDLYRIAPIKEGKGIARPVGPDRVDSYAVQVVPVRFFSVAEMKKLLSPFVTPGGEIMDYPRGNFLMVMDLPSNIQRLMEIRDLIDVQTFAGTRTEIYQPKIASAEELATEMNKVMQAYAASSPQAEGFAAQFLPIPRINQLLVIAHSEAAWSYVKRWLERIDVIAGGPGRRIFVYPVENSKAIELADILSQALGLATAARAQAPRSLQDLHRAMPSQPSGQGGQRGQQGMQGGQGGGFGYTPGSYQGAVPENLPGMIAQQAQQQRPQAAPLPQPVQPPGAAPRAPAPGAKPDAKPEEQLRIIADPATNMLIIYGTQQEFQNIKNILKELDIMPRQVLMDVLVASIDLSDSNSFGVDWQILRNRGDTFTGGFASSSSSTSGTPPVTTITPIPHPVLAGPAGLAVLAGTGASYVRGMITALATDGRAKVLAAPSILATDNRPARIQVGTEEPVPTGNQTSTEGLSQQTTIQYRNTGKIVTIIPQVNAKGLVILQIKAEVSERGADVQIGSTSKSAAVDGGEAGSVGASSSSNTFPSFNTTDAETTAVVQDGETLVIGGLIDETRGWSRTGVPFLKDLPVIGRFFGITKEDSKRRELVLLITPHVIRSVEESRDVTQDFKDKVARVTREIARTKGEEDKGPSFMPKPPPDESKPSPESSSSGASAPAEPQPDQGVWKSILKVLSFGLL
ncbi:MAG: type II secretion system protein GspD, partial [Deltaproteobacteria bacterium RIFCSPLOWO2_12_FULL_60_19]